MIQRRQAESIRTSTNGQNKEDLAIDLEYLTIRREIQSSNFFQITSKHIKIRIQSWIAKLDGIITNHLWKKNRNNYAKLINLACECQVIVEPFNSLPFQGDLPKLSKHKINSIIDAIERAVKNQSRLTKHSSSNSKNGDYDMYQSSKNKGSLQQGDQWSSYKEEQSSSFMNGRFGKTAELSHDQISFDTRNIQLLSVADQMKSLNESKKTYFINKTTKENICNGIGPNQTSQSNIKIRQVKHFPKHITLKLNLPVQQRQNHGQSIAQTSIKIPNNQSNYSSSCYNMIEGDQNSSYGFYDGNQLQNYTLNTEMFQNDFGVQPQPQEDQEFDYSGEISQRFKEKEEILKKDYFSWKQRSLQIPQTANKISSFVKHNIKFTETIPAKILYSQNPSINASIHIESDKGFSFQSLAKPYQINDMSEQEQNDKILTKENCLVDITDNFHNIN